MFWKWFKRRKIQELVSFDRAGINADILRAAIAERKPLCRHCFRVYEPQKRSPVDWLEFRNILMIPDGEPNPMICDECFAMDVASFNRRSLDVGTSNHGPANLVLQKLG